MAFTIDHGIESYFWRSLDTCLWLGNSEWIPYFHLLQSSGFVLPIKLPISQSMSFPTFGLPIISLIVLEDIERVPALVLTA